MHCQKYNWWWTTRTNVISVKRIFPHISYYLSALDTDVPSEVKRLHSISSWFALLGATNWLLYAWTKKDRFYICLVWKQGHSISSYLAKLRPTKNRAISWSEACQGKPRARTQHSPSTASVRDRMPCSSFKMTLSGSWKWTSGKKDSSAKVNWQVY